VEEANGLPPPQTHHALSHTAAHAGGPGARDAVGPYTWGGRSNQDTTDLSPDDFVHSLSVVNPEVGAEILEMAMTHVTDSIRWTATDSPAPVPTGNGGQDPMEIGRNVSTGDLGPAQENVRSGEGLNPEADSFKDEGASLLGWEGMQYEDDAYEEVFLYSNSRLPREDQG
jgi:hypothetical protein